MTQLKPTSAHPPSTADSLYDDAISEPIYDDGRSEPAPPEATSTPPPSSQPYRKNAQELKYGQIEHLRNQGGHRRFAPKGGQSDAIYSQVLPKALRKTPEELERDELFVDVSQFSKVLSNPKKPPPIPPKANGSGELIYTSVVALKATGSSQVPKDSEVVEYSGVLPADQAKAVIDAQAAHLKVRMTGAGLDWPARLDEHEALSSDFGQTYLRGGSPGTKQLDAMCSNLMKCFATPHAKPKLPFFHREKSYGAVVAMSETLAILRSDVGKTVTRDLATALDGSIVSNGCKNDPALIGLALHESLRRAEGGLSKNEREVLARHAKSPRSGLQNEISDRTQRAAELWKKLEEQDDDNGLHQLKAALRSVHVEQMALLQLRQIAAEPRQR